MKMCFTSWLSLFLLLASIPSDHVLGQIIRDEDRGSFAVTGEWQSLFRMPAVWPLAYLCSGGLSASYTPPQNWPRGLPPPTPAVIYFLYLIIMRCLCSMNLGDDSRVFNEALMNRGDDSRVINEASMKEFRVWAPHLSFTQPTFLTAWYFGKWPAGADGTHL